MSFPRYPKYKDSGVEWLGQVPEHWEVWKLAHAFELIGSGTTPKSDNREYYEGGNIAWVNTGDLNDGELDECEKRITDLAIAHHSSLKTYPAGSLLIAMYGATIGKLAMLRFPATVNQACCVFAGKSAIVSKFMFYWFFGLRQQIISLATGGGQPNVSQDILRTLRVACPNDDEQTRIAAFLDQETAKIDALVAKQKRLIELLIEKVKCLVLSSFDLPETKQLRFGSVAQIISRPVTQKEDEEYARIGLYNKGRGLFHREASEKDDMGDSDFFWVEEGDLIISGQFAWEGAVALASEDDTGCVVSHRFPVLRGVPGVSFTEYLFALLLTEHGDFLLNENSRGAAGRNRPLNITALLKEKIPLPSLKIQQAVVNAVHYKKQLLVEISKQIDLLQERRTALISAAVTGQIDVRQVLNSPAATKN